MCRAMTLLRAAVNAAKTSEHKFQLGAVVAQGSRIVSQGVNRYKTHPEQRNCYTGQHGGSIHAELDAVIRCPQHALPGSTVCVARITKSGQTVLARPCASCMKIMVDAGVSQVVFTTDEGYDTIRLDTTKRGTSDYQTYVSSQSQVA